MKILYTELISFFFGGVIGVMFKYWYDYKAMVYKALWEKRYETYKRMFSLSGTLPLYPKKSDITYEKLFKISEEMRDWYFMEGGLLLSTKSRYFYFDVQKRIQTIVNSKTGESRLQHITDDYDGIQKMFSDLRTEMTNDLMSRSRLEGFLSRKSVE